MNVFNKVALQSLKKNRTRTIVTVIGIMLSAAMICAVTTFASSMQNYLLDRAIYNEGDWHGSAANVDYEAYVKIGADDGVSESAYSQILGYAEIDSQNEYKPYMYVIGADQNSFFDMLPVHLVSGNYPKNSNEIIIPEHILTNGGLKYSVGDTVTLGIGERLLDGYTMGQHNPNYTYDRYGTGIVNDETIEVNRTTTYTIVGVYERPSFENYTAPGYTAITVSDTELGSTARFDVYFKMKNASEVYDFMEELKLDCSPNNDVLMFSGISRYSSFTTVIVSLAAIVIGLIMFGSVSLIYNAFAISVSERTKQFGLLSSIGATKRQLKRTVLFEALFVSAVGIPLGILVGIAGIWVTLLFIGNKFTSLLGDYDAPMRICVSCSSIVIAIAVALITVLISAWIPSKRATKVSAVEAIRQNSDIKANNKQVKTSKLTYRLFGLSGVIASKHYKRNKKKYRATVVSLFMSIVLFVSASAFTDYLTESASVGFSTNNFEISYSVTDDKTSDKTPNEILTLLTSDKDVTDGAYVSSQYFTGSVSTDYLTAELIEMLGEQSEQNDGYREISGFACFIADEEFDKLIKKYNLNRDDYYNSDNPLAITVDEGLTFNAAKEKFVTVDAFKGDRNEIVSKTLKQFDGYEYRGEESEDGGDRVHIYTNLNDRSDVLRIPYDEGFIKHTLKSGKTITEYPFYLTKSSSAHVYMLYPTSMYENVMLGQMQNHRRYVYYLQSENHAASFENLKKVLLENGIDSNNLVDSAAYEEEERNIVTIIQVFAYGFIVLISLIAAANVFNTISTNISLRRREFAMLKSVGMTEKDLNKMMNFECLLYGSKALLLGIPVSAVITYFIYLAISDGFETTYHLPWSAICISILSVFAVVFATMLYSMSKIKKDNPIDALRNENL